MVLVPMLNGWTDLKEEEVFPSSIAVILPLCLVSLGASAFYSKIDFKTALPYLFGGAVGAVPAGLWGQKIPVKWLHRGLGLMILSGGIRYLL